MLVQLAEKKYDIAQGGITIRETTCKCNIRTQENKTICIFFLRFDQDLSNFAGVGSHQHEGICFEMQRGTPSS